jgi:hypothetical protein
MTKTYDPLEPPTIAALQQMGLTGSHVACLNYDCRHSGTVLWEQLALPPETPFTNIKSRFRFRCHVCGSREVHLMPDWSGYRAEGMGRKDPIPSLDKHSKFNSNHSNLIKKTYIYQILKS